MRVDNHSISKFLSQSDMTFVIPVYQRNYDWQIGQCKQLINDIKNIIDTKNNHFIGTICIKPENRYSCIIIDGQQRITTVLLLLKAIHDLSNNDTLKRKIKNRFLIDEFSKDASKDAIKLKLKPIKKDEIVFTKLIENDNFIEKNFNIQDKYSNIYINYIYMKEMISKDIKNNLYTIEDFEDAIERLEIVELELDNENPQIIFESLNSTGLDLTDGDLLRNYLLMSLNYKDQEYLYNNYWRKIEELLNNDNKILVDFMTYYLITKKRSCQTIYNGKNAKIINSRLYSSFKRDYPHIDRNNIIEVENCFKEILQYARYYNRFIFDDTIVRENLNEIDKLFYDLIFVLKSKDSVIILMYLLNKYEKNEINHQTLITTVKALISLVVRASICDRYGLTTQFATFIIQKLDKINQTNDFIIEFWNAITMGNGTYSFPKDNEFKFSLETKPIYALLGSKKTKYILYEIEKIANPKETHIYSEGTIEHIMPQTLSAEWKKYLKDMGDLINYESHLHLLGNLSLTGYNSELGNMTFIKKKIEYSKSNYTNTRNITKYIDWNSKEIKNRGKELINLCLKAWELPTNYNKPIGVNLGVVYNLDTDFTLFTGTKPANVTFLGGTTKVNKWYDLVISVLTDCYDFDKQVFAMLLNYNGFYKNKMYLNTDTTNMVRPIQIAKSGIYFETCNSVAGHLRFIEKVLEFYDSKLQSDFIKDLSFTLSKI